MPWYITMLIILGVAAFGYWSGSRRPRRCSQCGSKLHGVCMASGCAGHLTA